MGENRLQTMVCIGASLRRRQSGFGATPKIHTSPPVHTPSIVDETVGGRWCVYKREESTRRNVYGVPHLSSLIAIQ